LLMGSREPPGEDGSPPADLEPIEDPEGYRTLVVGPRVYPYMVVDRETGRVWVYRAGEAVEVEDVDVDWVVSVIRRSSNKWGGESVLKLLAVLLAVGYEDVEKVIERILRGVSNGSPPPGAVALAATEIEAGVHPSNALRSLGVVRG